MEEGIVVVIVGTAKYNANSQEHKDYVVATAAIDTKNRLQQTAVEFGENNTLKSLPDEALQLTLGKDGSNWTFTYNDQKLGATAEKKLAWDSGTTTWTISIDATLTDFTGNVTITSTDTNCGKLKYNSNSGSGFFTTYTSDPTASIPLVRLYTLQ